MKNTTIKKLKIKLKDLKPNPFRNFEQYPINQDKVKNLQTSIKETGFWGNILCREKDGDVEIAYGHHRLTALRNLLSPDTEIDIIVKDLTDEEMIRIMGNENDERYNCLPAVVDETIKAARQFLEKNPKVAKYISFSGGSKVKRVRVGAPMIAKFLGGNWNLTKVQESLERIKLIDEGIIDPEALYLFPTAASTINFAKAVKQFKLEINFQKQIAEDLVESKRYGKRTINEAFREFYSIRDEKQHPGRAGYCDAKLKKTTSLINQAIKTLSQFENVFRTPIMFDGKTTLEDISEDTIRSFNRSVNELAKLLEYISPHIKKQ